MSKIGKKPIIIPDAITVTNDNGVLEFKKGAETVKLPVLQYVEASIDKAVEDEKEVNVINFTIKNDIKQARSNWGTVRALAGNIINGLTEGYKKVLEIEGVGYRASMDGATLVLNIGFSHPIKYAPKPGIAIQVEKNAITVSGISKEIVGQTAAEIRKIRKPEPYKGKGIRYQGEHIRRKAGKKVGK